MSEAKKNQILFLFSGIFLTGIGIYYNIGYILNGKFPDSIILLALGLHSLMLAYISPHIFPKNNNRAQKIIGKSMTINYFVLVGAMFILFFLTGPLGSLILSATQLLIILFCVMALTPPVAMIIYSKLI